MPAVLGTSQQWPASLPMCLVWPPSARRVLLVISARGISSSYMYTQERSTLASMARSFDRQGVKRSAKPVKVEVYLKQLRGSHQCGFHPAGVRCTTGLASTCVSRAFPYSRRSCISRWHELTGRGRTPSPSRSAAAPHARAQYRLVVAPFDGGGSPLTATPSAAIPRPSQHSMLPHRDHRWPVRLAHVRRN